MFTLFAWLISHQSTVLFSQNKPATSNQPAVLFSQNKPARATSQTNRLVVARGPYRGTAPERGLVCLLVAASCNPHGDANALPLILSFPKERDLTAAGSDSLIHNVGSDLVATNSDFCASAPQTNDNELVSAAHRALHLFFSTSELTLPT
jgi:hypothetical protein